MEKNERIKEVLKFAKKISDAKKVSEYIENVNSYESLLELNRLLGYVDLDMHIVTEVDSMRENFNISDDLHGELLNRVCEKIKDIYVGSDDYNLCAISNAVLAYVEQQGIDKAESIRSKMFPIYSF